MITGIVPGKHLRASSVGNNYYNYSSQPLAGMLRYHSGGRIEVFDGNSWQTVSASCNVELTPEGQSAIDWAIKKQKEETELEVLLDKHPGLKQAKEQFDIMLALVREHNDRKD
jgi:hypothetical protein